MQERLNRRALLCLAALSVFWANYASSQDKPSVIDSEALSKIAGGLRSAAQRVAQKFLGQPESDWVSQVAADANNLVELVSKVGKVSGFYGEMLTYDTLLLEKADTESDLRKALEYVSAAYNDISEKLEAITNFFEKPWSSDDINIPVEVSTVQKGQPVNELYIHFYMRGLPDAPAPHYVFSQPTTPTQERVPPGLYVIHVLNSNETLRQKREADVGGNGDLVKIEIPIR